MPGFNRTGPMGAGPMTGGGRGMCSTTNAGYDPRFTTDVNYGRGMGLRRGFRGGFGPDRGQGRGFGRGYRGDWPDGGPAYATNAPDEIDVLKAEVNELKAMVREIAGITKESKTESAK